MFNQSQFLAACKATDEQPLLVFSPGYEAGSPRYLYMLGCSVCNGVLTVAFRFSSPSPNSDGAVDAVASFLRPYGYCLTNFVSEAKLPCGDYIFMFNAKEF